MMETEIVRSDSDALIASFASFINNIEIESKTLKTIGNLQSICQSNQLTGSQFDELNDLFSSIKRLEISFDIFEDNIDTELSKLADMTHLIQKSEEQKERIERLKSSAVAMKSSNEKENTTRKEGSIDRTSFDMISKTIRGRLTFDQVNEASDVIVRLMNEKQRVCQSFSLDMCNQI